MDPRLNPSLSPHRPSAMQDIRPPAASSPSPTPPAATPLQPPPPHQSATTDAPTYEIVGSIPMAQPGMAPAATPLPVAAAPAAQPAQAPAADDDFEKILKAVNNRVQAPLQPPPKTRGKMVAKLASKVAKAKPAPKNNRPIGTMIAVGAVFLILSIVAVLAYKQGSKGSVLSNQASRVGTSYQSAASIQAAGGKLVGPGDLDDYSQDLGKKLNSLNDNQDFSADALSNSVLGL